jgi:hypothetical protein
VGQDVPVRPQDFAAALAGWLLIGIGGLVLANTAVTSGAPGVTGVDWGFALLAALVSVIAARNLWKGARWAWWLAVAYAVTALLFVVPVAAAVLFGGAEPVGTGWDVVLFPSLTALMLACLAALWVARRQ